MSHGLILIHEHMNNLLLEDIDASIDDAFDIYTFTKKENPLTGK